MNILVNEIKKPIIGMVTISQKTSGGNLVNLTAFINKNKVIINPPLPIQAPNRPNFGLKINITNKLSIPAIIEIKVLIFSLPIEYRIK